VAKEDIFKLEQAQDRRALSDEELQLRRGLTYKCLSLASLAWIIARHHSRLTFLKEGDANSWFFHLQAYHRGRQNRIDQVIYHDSVLIDEDQKAQAFFAHFNVILGSYEDRTFSLDFQFLGIPQL
jgi:hypothetical protein